MNATVMAGLLLATSILANAAEFNPRDFGAKADGKTLDTGAIQKAVDAAAKSNGTVVLSDGIYLSGSIFLKSHTNLRIDEGATLIGVQDLTAYPIMPTRVAGIEMKWPAALVNVYEQSDVKITGKGLIDGDGKIWWDKYWSLRHEYQPKGLRWASDYDCRRPRLIQIYKSSDVEVNGLNLHRSGFWTVHICYSRKVTVDGVTIRNNIGGRGPSTDGIDIDSSAKVLVQHCDISCNDDAICLKAGRDADGLRVNRPTEKIVIRDNIVRDGGAGITIGSETSGGIRDLEASGIQVFGPVPTGILFKSASTRGGTIQNIVIHDIVMHDVPTPIGITLNWNPSYSYAKIPADVKEVPDYWRVLAEPVPHDKGLPHFRDVHIYNIKATGAKKAFAVSSYPDAPLIDFEFKNIDIDAKTAGSIQNAQDWKLTDVRIKTGDGSRLAVKDSTDVTGLPKD